LWLGTWLGLEEAAKRLAVHPATLREWADRGLIRATRTPGGHRRFDEADVVELAGHRKPDLSLLMHATVGHARLATSAGRLASEAWYARFDDTAKQLHRELGVDLVQVLIAFLGDPDRGWAEDIRRLGSGYAELARRTGLSVADALRAFHLFEGMVRASVGELAAAKVGRADMDTNVGWFLNEVRVAMVEEIS
jgi:excisionase family DNA binding protein